MITIVIRSSKIGRLRIEHRKEQDTYEKFTLLTVMIIKFTVYVKKRIQGGIYFAIIAWGNVKCLSFLKTQKDGENYSNCNDGESYICPLCAKARKPEMKSNQDLIASKKATITPNMVDCELGGSHKTLAYGHYAILPG